MSAYDVLGFQSTSAEYTSAFMKKDLYIYSLETTFIRKFLNPFPCNLTMYQQASLGSWMQ